MKAEKPKPLTPRMARAIRALLEHGPTVQRECCESAIAVRLEKAGLATRGGRPLTLTLTPLGAALARESAAILKERLDRRERSWRLIAG